MALNLDQYKWILPTVMVLTCILQFGIPIIYLISSKKPRKKEANSHNSVVTGTKKLSKEEIPRPWWKRRNITRVWSLHLFFSLWFWVIYLISCSATKCLQYGHILKVLFIFGGVMIILSYFYMLFESMIAKENIYIQQLQEADLGEVVIARVRNGRPKISMNAKAWHMEKSNRDSSTTDPHGRLRHYNQTSWEQVITNELTETFEYSIFTDHSEIQAAHGVIQRRGVSKLKMDLEVDFGDTDTEVTFDLTFTRFKDRTQFTDRNVEHKIFMEVPGYKKSQMTFMDRETIPKWMTKTVYWTFASLGLTWIFRIAFRQNVQKVICRVDKRIYVNHPVGSPILPDSTTNDIYLQPSTQPDLAQTSYF